MDGQQRFIALVMAGGKGSRLFPLTLDRAKPAVPFGGRYRIIDFVLSNLANSGIRSVYVLTQYKSQSLSEHVQRTWGARGAYDSFVSVVPAQMRRKFFLLWPLQLSCLGVLMARVRSSKKRRYIAVNAL